LAAKSHAGLLRLKENSMSEVIDAIKGHHRELMAHIIDGTESLANGDVAQLDAFVQLLKSDLLPHAGGEEVHLYPAIDPLIRDHGHASAIMRVDHEFISGYVQDLEQAGNALQHAAAADRPELARRVARLAIGLEALLKVHLEKEERVYRPLFERYLSISDQQRVLDGLHEAYDAQVEPAVGQLLDVRRVVPAQRHVLIFETFDHLQPGDSFILINDHEPKPLYYQFAAELAGQFEWTPLQSGPTEWRAEIRRTTEG
jgi:uncharacterized protein (DUF2249 family)/hemerythrin-like domain-containing protein